VLAQPFPSVPLIGPRTLGELDDSLKALDIRLSAADLAWLDGGDHSSLLPVPGCVKTPT